MTIMLGACNLCPVVPMCTPSMHPLTFPLAPSSAHSFNVRYFTDAGYNGANSSMYWELNQRGAWVSLLMQSPWGELPTGGRSSQHQWNEAVSCVTYEYWARHYATQGNASAAGAFKRAAALSLNSLKRWKRPTGVYVCCVCVLCMCVAISFTICIFFPYPPPPPSSSVFALLVQPSLPATFASLLGEWFILKNRFDPKLRHGYESYSYYSQVQIPLFSPFFPSPFPFAFRADVCCCSSWY